MPLFKPVAAAAALLATTLAIPVLARADVLPDGRVYEQVSPVEKNGSDAGSLGVGAPVYSHATADGSGLLYGTRGPMGTVHRGIQAYAVGRRGSDGWSSESALPAGTLDRIFALTYSPYNLVPSDDLTKIMFTAFGSYGGENPVSNTSAGLYMGNADDGTVDWLSQPRIANPVPAPGNIIKVSNFEPVGGSPDLSTVYFWAGPTLLPADAARAPFWDPNDADSTVPWGLYQYSGGVLTSAGTLPDGTEPAGGAAPASSGRTERFVSNFTTPETTGHQVSRDGSTLLFVSPDPQANPLTGPHPIQLYVRRGGRSTLISHSPDGAAAPSGVVPVVAVNQSQRDLRAHEYAYGSADGKTAIFQSPDVLASGAPNDSAVKAYRYDVDTDTVSYLPGVAGATIVAASDDDQRFLFTDSETRIAVWDQGNIKTVASSPTPTRIYLSPARSTATGSVFVFTTEVAIPGFNGGGFVQVYRYDTAQQQLTCVSCPPAGIAPSGSATLSNEDTVGNAVLPSGELVGSRGMSEDGDRVFFDTPDALVPDDANAKRDVYEWTPSGVSLISSGRSQDPSILLDNSANGNDVFFATTEGLDPDDRDLSYDVYDARVGGGFTRAERAAPCAGDACRGALSGPLLSPLPGTSGAFDGDREQVALVSSVKLKLGVRKVLNGSLRIVVAVPLAARVSVSGSGLRGVGKAYTTPGTYTIKVPLTAAAKRNLKRRHRLKLSARVQFAPTSGAASSSTFTLTAKA
ncbi:MAG TPA: hypothetical protein VLJ42_09235 [Solirubrobacteraceae bacterium]|nr:hypothetical protein [Solirubrobacteraceae bacterium]